MVIYLGRRHYDSCCLGCDVHPARLPCDVSSSLCSSYCVLGDRTNPLDVLDSTRWLTLREKAISVYRLEKDTGVRDEETMSLFQSFRSAATDYKLYLLALIIVTKTTAGAVTQFIPTVVATFGMSKVNTLLLTAPPYLLAAVIALVLSYTSDRKPERCFHLLTPILFGMVGYVCVTALHAKHEC